MANIASGNIDYLHRENRSNRIVRTSIDYIGKHHIGEHPLYRRKFNTSADIASANINYIVQNRKHWQTSGITAVIENYFY